jgi:hypothetical protein
MFHPFFNFFL